VFNLVTEYPTWFLLFCLLTGAVFSAGLYFRQRPTDISLPLLRVLIILRFLSVTFISFLLLTPLVRRTINQVEKPIIVIGLDGSASMITTGDSSNVRKSLPENLEKLARDLSGRFMVKTYTFGDQLSPGLQNDFKRKSTDISLFFDEMSNRYSGKNLGAVILASDGIFNKGSNPYYSALKLNVPVYTISTGDTNRRKDALIRNITVNREVYLNDQFPFEMMIEFTKCKGQASKLQIMHSGQVVFSKSIIPSDDHSVVRLEGVLQARERGIQKYSVELQELEGEISKINNKRDFYIDVVESRIKVAIVYENPHPDIASIASALGSSEKFEVSQFTPFELKSSGKIFHLYIFYQLPSLTGTIDPSKLIPQGSPILFIVGNQTDLSGFNRMKSGLIINSQKRNLADVLPILNPDFSLFSIDPQLVPLIGEFPPLQCPSGSFESGAATDILFFQKIGNVQTRIPLVMFFNLPERKTGIIAGENFWRWRLLDYIRKSDFTLFDDLFTRIAQYLSVKTDTSPFRVNVKSRIEEGSALEFDASLFNATHELVNTPDASLELTNENGKTYPFIFTRTGKGYYLNAGIFPYGSFTYTATTSLGNSTYKKHGQLTVTPLDLEMINLVADHNLMHRIASSHDGAMVSENEIPKLEEILMNRDDLKSISHERKKFTDLTGNLWIFITIMLLISGEWALRKRNGL